MSTICVVGLGYIGLPTAAMLASRGHSVIGFDVNARVVETINEGRPHFHEPDLQMLLSAAVQTGRLRAQSTPVEADYFIIAVPTPFKEGNVPDMSFVESATAQIAPILKRGDTVILESTSPVGSTEAMTAQLRAARPDLAFPLYQEGGDADIRVAHCPERVMPGQMVRELVANDRIIGGMSNECAEAARGLYECFVSGEAFLTDCRTAEFVKLIENSYRDVNIAFANELSLICSELSVDVWRAIELANKHPRVNILRPGAGVGGHCIAVDPYFIVYAAPRAARLIRTAREVNESKPQWVSQQVAGFASRFRDPVVACYGLTYKQDVDDLRESPAVEIAGAIARNDGVQVLVVEPNVKALPPILQEQPNIKLVDADTARQQADIVVFLVAHRQFKQMDKRVFLDKVVLDVVGLIS
jgi:UDP-N-acetyl-D-mannosaminuronic acid dehydrogenase